MDTRNAILQVNDYLRISKIGRYPWKLFMPGTTIRVPADLQIMVCANLTTQMNVFLGS